MTSLKRIGKKIKKGLFLAPYLLRLTDNRSFSWLLCIISILLVFEVFFILTNKTYFLFLITVLSLVYLNHRNILHSNIHSFMFTFNIKDIIQVFIEMITLSPWGLLKERDPDSLMNFHTPHLWRLSWENLS